MRIIFMGSPEFAIPTLDGLVTAGHEVVAVYAQPPRRAGRGQTERKTAVHERAAQLGIEVRTPRTLRDAEEQTRLMALRSDYAVVAAYGLILPTAVLKAPQHGCINVHASLLPRWRGAAPIQRAILAGDEVSGVTIMQMDEGLDTGPILLRRELDISSKSSGLVTLELAILGAEALVRCLELQPPPRPQPLDGVTYASKIAKVEARIDWAKPAVEIERAARAFDPFPGAWFEVNSERIKLLQAETVPVSGTPGEVLDENLLIAAGVQAIRPVKLQRAGRAPMTAGELVRGFPVSVGTILS